jgi:hypothetical protein
MSSLAEALRFGSRTITNVQSILPTALHSSSKPREVPACLLSPPPARPILLSAQWRCLRKLCASRLRRGCPRIDPWISSPPFRQPSHLEHRPTKPPALATSQKHRKITYEPILRAPSQLPRSVTLPRHDRRRSLIQASPPLSSQFTRHLI